MSDDSEAQWSTFYRTFPRERAGLWPPEALVRMMLGSYVPGYRPELDGKRVLDVGFGRGNSLPFLRSLGLEIAGVELSAEICALARERLARFGVTAELRVGTSRALPFDDGSFDYLVSWDVIHYEDSEDGVLAALREYRRVLRPGGRLFLETTGPEDSIMQGCEYLGGHRYRVRRPDDFRQGTTFFYWGTELAVKAYLSRVFDAVEVGRLRDRLFTRDIDSFVATGVKP